MDDKKDIELMDCRVVLPRTEVIMPTDISELTKVFDDFCLDQVPKQWVSKLMKSMFILKEEATIPDEYEAFVNEDKRVLEVLDRAIAKLHSWSKYEVGKENMGSTTEDINWFKLKERVNSNAFICLLYAYVKQGLQPNADFETRCLSLKAASLYLIAISIHSSQAFGIFQTGIYLAVLELLNNTVITFNTTIEFSPVVSSNSYILYSSANQVLECLTITLHSIDKFVVTDGMDDCLQSTMHTLVCLTCMGRKSSNLCKNLSQETGIQVNPCISIALNAYKLIRSFLNLNHESLLCLLNRLFRVIRPLYNVTLSTYLDVNLGPEIGNVRENWTCFLMSLVDDYGYEAYRLIRIILQKILLAVHDSASIKLKEIRLIQETMSQIQGRYFSDMVYWYMQACYMNTVQHRSCALEILHKLLTDDASRLVACMEDDSDVRPSGSRFSTPEYIIGIILNRCVDEHPGVKWKVFSILVNLMTSTNELIRSVFEKIFVVPYEQEETITGTLQESVDFRHIMKDPSLQPLPSGHFIINLIRETLKHERVLYRKSGLQLLCQILSMNPKWAVYQNSIQHLEKQCLNQHTSIRRMLVNHFTEVLISHPNNEIILEHWINGVVMLVVDQELRIQDEVSKKLCSLILGNLVNYSEDLTLIQQLPFTILKFLAKKQLRKQLCHCTKKWAQAKSIKPHHINTLYTYLNTKYNNLVWFFLVTIAQSSRVIKDVDVIYKYFEEKIHLKDVQEDICAPMVMETLGCCIRNVEQKSKVVSIVDQIKENIVSYSLPVSLLTSACNTVYIGLEYSDKDSLQQTCFDFFASILDHVHQHIMSPDFQIRPTENALQSRKLYSYAEAMLFSPSKVKQETLERLEKHLGLDGSSPPTTQMNAMEVGLGITILMRRGVKDDAYSQKILPLLMKYLNQIRHPTVKLIILNGLCDQVFNFDNLIEPLMPEMYLYLMDENQRLRTESLQMVIGWIKEDFLRIQPPLYFYLSILMVDKVTEVKRATFSFFVNCALQKDPQICLKYFIVSIFHFNQYKGHRLSEHILSEREHEVYYIGGQANGDTRFMIYKYMLELLKDDHKEPLLSNLVVHIISGITRKTPDLVLSEAGNQLLRDTLRLLACEDLYTLSSKSAVRGEDEDEAEEIRKLIENANVSKTAKQKESRRIVIRERYYRNLLELRTFLKGKNHPLMVEYYVMLCVLIRLYKSEILAIISVCGQLLDVKEDLATWKNTLKSKPKKSPPETILDRSIDNALLTLNSHVTLAQSQGSSSSSQTPNKSNQTPNKSSQSLSKSLAQRKISLQSKQKTLISGLTPGRVEEAGSDKGSERPILTATRRRSGKVHIREQ